MADGSHCTFLRQCLSSIHIYTCRGAPGVMKIDLETPLWYLQLFAIHLTVGLLCHLFETCSRYNCYIVMQRRWQRKTLEVVMILKCHYDQFINDMFILMLWLWCHYYSLAPLGRMPEHVCSRYYCCYCWAVTTAVSATAVAAVSSLPLHLKRTVMEKPGNKLRLYLSYHITLFPVIWWYKNNCCYS